MTESLAFVVLGFVIGATLMWAFGLPGSHVASVAFHMSMGALALALALSRGEFHRR